MDLLNVTVLGDPVVKSRPRVGKGRGYTPKRTVAAEAVIRTAALEAYGFPTAWPDPVGIDVTFYCATRRRTDGDNLLKLVTDALQQNKKAERAVIVDDSQILDWHCRLHRRVEGQEPRTEIRLYCLDV